MNAAIENLRTSQKQLDADGCMVGVSRQALDETLALVATLTAALESARVQMDMIGRHFPDCSAGACRCDITDEINKVRAAIAAAES